MAYSTGIVTGLMGYSLKKEMLGDALFYRELHTFSYELYSLDMTGLSPTTIQNHIYDEFTAKYSGDINVKVFSQPADYYFPNDAVRSKKFNVEVQVKSVPNISQWQSELSSNYYQGLNSAFFVTSGANLLDFKENFDFSIEENGVQVFNHDISFGLRSGSKIAAANLASGIFTKDKDTTFGINVMVGNILTIADSSIYQNYYTESYDTLRNVYAFGRKREVLPTGVSTYVYNIVHILDLREDGVVDVSEKGNVKGKLNFTQAQQGADVLLGGAYARCNSFYGTYANFANSFSTPITATLINTPTKTLKMYNRPAISADYEMTFTNNPVFLSDGTTVEETFDLNDIQVGVIDLKHTLNFSRNKRTTSSSIFDTKIANALATSPTAANQYFLQYYSVPPTWPLHLVKKEITWPNIKGRGARVLMQYNNHPKYFFDIGGTIFNTLEHKVAHTQPVDITTEYKVINRPNKLSVLNYAYQTEKGSIVVTIDASIGRNPDEFITSFRTDIGPALTKLYTHAATVFFNEFKNVVPLAFTYYLQDVKYTFNSENGILQLTVSFGYTMKKYIL